MSTNRDSNRERERIRRLRDQQIRSRDPGPRVKVEWKGDKAVKKQPLWELFWGALPPMAKGAIGGMAFGIVVSVIMGIALPYPWNAACGSLFFLLAIGVGIIVGNSTDQGGYID